MTSKAEDGTERDRPWIMRTYAGHSYGGGVSNALYRKQPRARDRPASRVAFDSADADRATTPTIPSRKRRGRQGRRAHLVTSATCGPSSTGMPLEEMNTSMTINATAALAASRSTSPSPRSAATTSASSAGTVQNDIVKEYLSRGTYVFPPAALAPPHHGRRSPTRSNNVPKWNPTNVCSYHLQEAGATPAQELAYALCHGHRAVLDAAKRDRSPG